jgi:CubicO group peptidase (beta-lactamase class C family)
MKKAVKYFLFILIPILFVTENSFSQQVKNDEINSIIKDFDNEDAFAAGEAIKKIVKYGEQAVDCLIESLADGNDNIRWCSAITLEKIAPEGTKAILPLINALKDRNSNVRWNSAIALGEYGAEAIVAVPALLDLLNDDDRDIRRAAYVSLNKIDNNAVNKAPEISGVISKIENLTPQLMKELNVPGVSISIIKSNKLEWSKCFGVSDAVSQNKVNDKTIFEACSMSKPVFAYLILKLVEDEKLNLDKPLSNYHQEKFVSTDEDYSKLITARMILTHTSGLPNWRKGDEERDGPLPIYFKPGMKFSYSGEGFYYLQRVVESIIKEPIETFARNSLFDELGFESTSFIWTEQIASRISTGHDSSGNCLKKSKYLHANSAYTLYTTPDEYAKFIIEIIKSSKSKNVSLSEKTIQEMLIPQIRSDIREVTDRPGRSLGLFSYRGLGWAIDSTITGNIIYHSGSNQTGFRCYSQFNAKEGSGVVIMTNGANGNELWSKLISVIGDL